MTYHDDIALVKGACAHEDSSLKGYYGIEANYSAAFKRMIDRNKRIKIIFYLLFIGLCFRCMQLELRSHDVSFSVSLTENQKSCGGLYFSNDGSVETGIKENAEIWFQNDFKDWSYFKADNLPTGACIRIKRLSDGKK